MMQYSRHRRIRIGRGRPLSMRPEDSSVLGSLLVRELVAGEETNANMFVPIDRT